MMELAKKVIRGYKAHYEGKCGTDCPYYPSTTCINTLEANAEVVLNAASYGHWIEYTYKDDKTKAVVLTAWRCSNCQHFHDKKDKYCPNCGIEMEGIECNDDEG